MDLEGDVDRHGDLKMFMNLHYFTNIDNYLYLWSEDNKH